MLLLISAVLTVATLFIGGAYVLDYPVTLGVLYGINVILMYLVLWSLSNQAVKIFTQKMIVQGNVLYLSRKQIFLSFPVVRHMDLDIPLDTLRRVSLIQTRLGYLLTLRFEKEGKLLGMDLDLNPLRLDNAVVIKEILNNRGLVPDKTTSELLDSYDKLIGSWKRHYLFSFIVLMLALGIFLWVSIYLGIRVQ